VLSLRDYKPLKIFVSFVIFVVELPNLGSFEKGKKL